MHVTYPDPTQTVVVPALMLTDVDELAAVVDEAWEQREMANKELTYALAALLIRQTREAFPSAQSVTIREDTSHLPAHGHIDDIQDASGVSLVAQAERHHGWPAALDDLAWEIYQVAHNAFGLTLEGKRVLTVAVSP